MSLEDTHMARFGPRQSLRQRWQALTRKWTHRFGMAWNEWFGELDIRKRRQCYPNVEPLESRNLLNSVSIMSTTQSVHEYDGTVTISVNGVGDGHSTFSVNYSTTDGTAVAGTDYSAVSGTLTFVAVTSTIQTFTVPIIDEGDGSDAQEQFTVTLSSPSNCTISNGSDTIKILPGLSTSW